MRRLAVLAFALAFAAGALLGAFALPRITPAWTHPGLQVARSATANTGDAEAHDAGESDADETATGYWPDDADTPEQVLYAQPRMMHEAIARLAPREPGHPNLYFVGFAGDGEQDVFLNEARYAQVLFARRFAAAGHELLLANNPATLEQNPLASLTNLEQALQAVGARMERDEDILVLLLTSHGAPDPLLYVAMDPLPLDQIAPEDLAEVLAKSTIRYTVVVISACYSGGFIEALKGSDTMVITAARADRASFGCGTDAPITDFGRAFLVEGLNQSDSFVEAFAQARSAIGAREAAAHDEPSMPQLSSAPGIEAQLRRWRKSFTPGAPVPFIAPASRGKAFTAAR